MYPEIIYQLLLRPTYFVNLNARTNYKEYLTFVHLLADDQSKSNTLNLTLSPYMYIQVCVLG